MPRASRYALAALAALAFVMASAALARVLAAAGAERAAAIAVITAQARGEQQRVVSSIVGCRARTTCRRRVARNVRRLRTQADVRVLRVDGPSRLAVGARVGRARVAWRAGQRLPLVQCVSLARRGTLFSGFRVEVLEVGDPLPAQAGCAPTSGTAAAPTVG